MAFCTECGAKVPDEIRFCTECGNPMANAAPPAPAMAAASAVMTPPMPEAAYTPPRPAAPPVQPQQPVYSAPSYQSAPRIPGPDAPPPHGSPYAVVGTGGYIGMMILFVIPVIGWIACIVMAFASKNKNRRNFAKAMFIFLIIGIVISVALYFVITWVWEVVVEYLGQHINEATGGQITDFDGLGDIFGIFGALDGLDISSLPGQ